MPGRDWEGRRKEKLKRLVGEIGIHFVSVKMLPLSSNKNKIKRPDDIAC